MNNHPQLFLNTRSRKFDGRHPWVHTKSVIDPTLPLEDGTVVDLAHPDGRWIGRGFYNSKSRIRVRLYQWEQRESLDLEWLVGMLQRSVALRQRWMQTNGELDAVRLVNSEGDGLSGLIADRFGEYLVLQITSLPMWNWLEEILAWFREHVPTKGIRVCIDTATAGNEGIAALDEWREGAAPSGAIEIVENGLRIEVDLSTGQKTGYYLDQRQNRQRAAKWAETAIAGGGEMLDVCCYLGGFSLAACQQVPGLRVTAVDSSAKALDQARRNAELNSIDQMDFHSADCFDFLAEKVSQGKKYRVVVLDPPKMASNRNQVAAALRAYHRLNLSAVQLLEPGGILITCSCTGRVFKSDLVGVLSAVSKRTHRNIQILESSGADFDHPIDVNCPESDYLKCLVCNVS